MCNNLAPFVLGPFPPSYVSRKFPFLLLSSAPSLTPPPQLWKIPFQISNALFNLHKDLNFFPKILKFYVRLKCTSGLGGIQILQYSPHGIFYFRFVC